MTKCKNLGRVVISAGYVVDLDDEEMVDHAKESLFEDIMNAVKYNELGGYIEVDKKPDPDLTEQDIPSFLLWKDGAEA